MKTRDLGAPVGVLLLIAGVSFAWRISLVPHSVNLSRLFSTDFENALIEADVVLTRYVILCSLCLAVSTILFIRSVARWRWAIAATVAIIGSVSITVALHKALEDRKDLGYSPSEHWFRVW